MSKRIPPHQDYSAGHPWYFHLGGPIPGPRAIRDHVIASGYGGYRASEIAVADKRPEPARTRALTALENDIRRELKSDLHRYRQTVRELKLWQEANGQTEPGPTCADIHIAMSLTFAHVMNGLANLRSITACSRRQLDLFALM
jgi:hypothetical protein